jgi:hypothetical protein
MADDEIVYRLRKPDTETIARDAAGSAGDRPDSADEATHRRSGSSMFACSANQALRASQVDDSNRIVLAIVEILAWNLHSGFSGWAPQSKANLRHATVEPAERKMFPAACPILDEARLH